MHQFFLVLQTENKFTKIMPSMRHCLLLIAATAVLSSALSSCSSRPEYRRIEGFAQGGTFHIIYSAPAAGVDEDNVISLVSGRLQGMDFANSAYKQGPPLQRFTLGEERST